MPPAGIFPPRQERYERSRPRRCAEKLLPQLHAPELWSDCPRQSTISNAALYNSSLDPHPQRTIVRTQKCFSAVWVDVTIPSGEGQKRLFTHCARTVSRHCRVSTRVVDCGRNCCGLKFSNFLFNIPCGKPSRFHKWDVEKKSLRL